MTTPSWISTLMQLTASPWKDISTKEPATPLRPGAGTALSLLIYFFGLETLFPHHSFLFQALVFNSEKPAGVSEEVQGMF